jgi:hypothetical protein
MKKKQKTFSELRNDLKTAREEFQTTQNEHTIFKNKSEQAVRASEANLEKLRASKKILITEIVEKIADKAFVDFLKQIPTVNSASLPVKIELIEALHGFCFHGHYNLSIYLWPNNLRPQGVKSIQKQFDYLLSQFKCPYVFNHDEKSGTVWLILNPKS